MNTLNEMRKKLVNSLRFERAKNNVLLTEVLGLEDEIVNRKLADYGDAISEDVLPFWREQLLGNRAQAEVALAQFMVGKAEKPKEEKRQRPRPMHNRAVVRPVVRSSPGATGHTEAEAMAGRIRNRAKEMMTSEGIPFSVAFRRAEKEVMA